MDAHFTMAIWDWEVGELLAESHASSDRIFSAMYNPYDDTVVIMWHPSYSILETQCPRLGWTSREICNKA